MMSCRSLRNDFGGDAGDEPEGGDVEPTLITLRGMTMMSVRRASAIPNLVAREGGHRRRPVSASSARASSVPISSGGSASPRRASTQRPRACLKPHVALCCQVASAGRPRCASIAPVPR